MKKEENLFAEFHSYIENREPFTDDELFFTGRPVLSVLKAVFLEIYNYKLENGSFDE